MLERNRTNIATHLPRFVVFLLIFVLGVFVSKLDLYRVPRDAQGDAHKCQGGPVRYQRKEKQKKCHALVWVVFFSLLALLLVLLILVYVFLGLFAIRVSIKKRLLLNLSRLGLLRQVRLRICENTRRQRCLGLFFQEESNHLLLDDALPQLKLC